MMKVVGHFNWERREESPGRLMAGLEEEVLEKLKMLVIVELGSSKP